MKLYLINTYRVRFQSKVHKIHLEANHKKRSSAVKHDLTNGINKTLLKAKYLRQSISDYTTTCCEPASSNSLSSETKKSIYLPFYCKTGTLNSKQKGHSNFNNSDLQTLTSTFLHLDIKKNQITWSKWREELKARNSLGARRGESWLGVQSWLESWLGS